MSWAKNKLSNRIEPMNFRQLQGSKNKQTEQQELIIHILYKFTSNYSTIRAILRIHH